MKHRMSMGVALSMLLVTLAGCTFSSEPLGPSARQDTPTVPSTTPDFPSLTRNAATYDRRSSSFIPGVSRYAFYGDSTFSLQYATPAFGFFEYPGTSSRSDSVINFKFEGWSIWGPWLATGVVHGDSLTVKYNLVMVMSDFEDGVYVRTGK